ncbi:unnamed protein product [Rotaria sordida]|uniref:BZIP domain-containing protein n=1 Tax=Rotaria sordida TaxID=392033 RepID=A0A813N0M2_9BILA|nr:unnamed protein product [Rotaria sordida]CAF0731571.1 unnamed protein product [Rotaria sordida]
MACWLEQPTSNKEFCDAIDEIMKHEHEDVILLDDTLSSGAPLELDLDSISDLLETPSTAPVTTASAVSPISPSSTTDYSQSTNIYDMASPSHTTYSANNNSRSNSTASTYSVLGISPKFTTLSINQHHHPFSPPPQDSNNSSTSHQSFGQSPIVINSKNSLHPPPYIQEQQNTSILGTSYPFELPINTGLSDVKRFRSASMNEGPTQQHQTKLDPHLFDPYRLKLHPYINPPYYQNRTSSTSITTTPTTTTTASSTSPLSNDVLSNTAWPFVGCPRPTSSSFSEVLNQQQQLQLRQTTNLSASFGGTPSFYPLHHQRNQTGFLPDMNFQPQQTTNCTLYSLNQPTGGGAASSPSSSSVLARKRSLVGFPVQEIKDDPSSPACTMEQQSEPDLWSDIEQNSSDHIQDNDLDDGDITSDDDATTVSSTYNKDLETTKSTPSQSNSASLFWQYNVQAKGPKTKRILYLKERDPHLFREFSDPVYQIKLTQTKGQTFTKLRKGDGNDVTPNPMKLYQLGKQIRDLSSFVGKTNSNTQSVYHGIYHIDHQINNNNNDTAEVKKEKNKIASRACRLRKKAQHEANKLKLHGLNEEHKTLLDLMTDVKLLILKRYHNGQLSSPSSSPNQSLEMALDQLIANKYSKPVAGNTDGFVQGVINDMERLYASKQQRSNSLNT